MRFKIMVPRGDVLTANQRLHWAQRAKRSRMVRQMGHAQAATTLMRNPAGVLDRAHITVTVSWPDKRRRDVHNIMPTIKAAIDGIVDAGMLPDDSDAHLIGPDLRVSSEKALPGFVEFEFEVVAA